MKKNNTVKRFKFRKRLFFNSLLIQIIILLLFMFAINTITNAPNVDKLTGPGYQIGGSYTGAPVVVGGDLNIIPDSDNNTTYYYGGTLSGGFAYGSGGEVHATIGKTFPMPKTKFNVFDVAKAAYIKIMEW